MDGKYFNDSLIICKTAQPHCRICGYSENWQFTINTNVNKIIKEIRRYGWSAGNTGLVCPTCQKIKE